MGTPGQQYRPGERRAGLGSLSGASRLVAGSCGVAAAAGSALLLGLALTFAAYAAPAGWDKPVAIAAVLALAAVNYRGVTRTAALTKAIVAVVLCVLALVVIAGWVAAGSADAPGPGLAGATLPWPSVVAGLIVLAVGIAYRWIRLAVCTRCQ